MSQNNCSMLSLFVLLMNLYGGAFGQNTTTADPPQLLVTKLIHHQALDSPFYDPTKTIQDLADMAITSSISRALYLSARANGSLEHPTDIESQLIPGQQYGFLAHLRVGSEEVEQWLFMDTGSNLLWLNCEPNDSNPPTPLFNPKQSTSYEAENCNFRYTCDGAGNVKIRCDDYGSDVDGCIYSLNYIDKSYSRGYLGRETFKFGKKKTETLRNIVFGCASSSSFYLNGVLGLGNLKISLTSQYSASKFSYCIGDITDRSYAYNELVIGEKVELWGFETPLVIDSYYYITLEGITIGNTPLAFDPNIFKKTEYGGGMLIDSGASYTFIPQVVLSDLQTTIIRTMRYRLTRREGVFYKGKVPRLCYDGRVGRDLNWFPEVKLQFQDGAIMLLTPDNIFERYNATLFCLSILPSEYWGISISILGNMLQQNFYVAYDLSRKKLSFKRMDCKSVDEYYARDEL